MEPERKRKVSAVWDHFDLLSANKVKCRICSAKLSYTNKSTYAMLRHYRVKHANEEEANTPRTNTESRKIALDQAVLNFIIKDCQPLSIVESEGFRGLIQVLDPSYALPTRKVFTAISKSHHVFPTTVQQMALVKEEAPEEQRDGVDQQDPEHLHIKEEQEELWISVEGEQLHLKKEIDVVEVPLTTVSIKSEDDEEKPLFSELHQQQTEDGDVPTSSSADQITAETWRSPDLNPCEQTDTSETEVSTVDEENGDVNLDSELSDFWPENDDDWNESRTSDSDVKKTINKSFSCSECGEHFLRRWSLQIHVRETSHSAIGSSGCLVDQKCDVEKRHVDSCRNVKTKLKSFVCNDCGKEFRGKSNLKNHVTVHTREKPFACELCGQRFSRKQVIDDHMRIHSGQKPFACEVCGQRFSRKTYLFQHARVHTGQKPFACEICGQRFGRRPTLKSHMRVHTGEKPYACQLCRQRFSQKASFNRHMEVHTGHKPFACELCGQRFARKATLDIHMRLHTGQKPFACELCGQRYTNKSNLNVHMRIHTGQK
ncbi:transcript variant X1 [Nothobranchius furzeri]|uniref:Transcript variant X1 n=1 Tax=Nothobranchius furzeri TaxID=105023 RepID=A0A9D2Z1L3_NOTFU|nr:transcript variant X1 [Nothobranchius furzeri]